MQYRKGGDAMKIHSVTVLLAVLIALTGCGSVDVPEYVEQEPQTSLAASAETASASPAATSAETTKATKATKATAAKTEAVTETESSAPAEPVGTGLYDQLLTKLSARETVIRFSEAIPRATLNQVVNEVLRDHPELFWVQRWTTTMSSSWSKLEFNVEYSDRELAEMSEKLNAAMQTIIEQVPADADPYTKALIVHDYLVLHTEYDTAAASDPELMTSVSAYDCLVTHKAVCSGYSKAYQLVMQRLGLECGICSGMSRGVSHAWNYVQIGGRYYWVDVTFDDPVASDGGEDTLEHSYFMINDEMLLRTREIGSEDPFVPVCDALDQNYYVRNGAFLEAYSQEDADAVIARMEGQPRVEIMFRTAEAYHEAVTDLLDNKNIWDLPAIQASGSADLHYKLEDDMYVLILLF